MVCHCCAHIYVHTCICTTHQHTYIHVHTHMLMRTGNTLTSTKDHASSQKQQTVVSSHDCLLVATRNSRSNYQFSFPKRVFSFCGVQESICLPINCLFQASIFFHVFAPHLVVVLHIMSLNLYISLQTRSAIKSHNRKGMMVD